MKYFEELQMIFNDESWDVVFARAKTASESRLSIDCAYDNMQGTCIMQKV